MLIKLVKQISAIPHGIGTVIDAKAYLHYSYIREDTISRKVNGPAT